MKKPIGTDLIQGVQDLLDAQMGTAQGKKQDETFEALGDFVRKYGIPVEPAPVNSLARLLRNKGAEVNRQVRTLSDALLLKDERELEEELELLREKLSKVEATFHQVKTKNAFVLTVLRPFNPKFAERWFEERTDINSHNLRGVIESLEGKALGSVLDITDWAEEVSVLFEQLVVYRGEDAEDYYSRPAGTISAKSSRTYLQAWLAFTGLFKHKLWSLVSGEVAVEKKTKSISFAEDDRSMGFDQTAPKRQEPTRSRSPKSSPKDNLASFSMMMAPPQENGEARYSRSAPRFSKTESSQGSSSASTENSVGWIQIFIESKLDSSAQATRKWESQADFRQSLQKWLDTLPVIWGPAADQFVAKVSVKTATGESDLTLPSLNVKDAAERLTKAVEMQQD